MRNGLVTVFLAGDVMTGRGIDQILPRPGDARLSEPHIADARAYVELAERANGPIPRPVEVSWPWGVALRHLDELQPDVRLINLETSLTRSADADATKAVHYRMNPDNVGCVEVASPHACALANNHVLDFGWLGMAETLVTLAAAGIRAVGAGRDAHEAARPAMIPVEGGRRAWVFSCGTRSSGIPTPWAASADGPGIDLLPDLSEDTAAVLAERARRVRAPGDLVITSIHWGSNWGYDVPAEHSRFAHWLIDSGIDVVHGHSSHHPRPIEVYRGKLILYGCGDLIDDYEGITGHERYRPDLRLLYFASLAPGTGNLEHLRMAPVQAHRMRLRAANREDAAYLQGVLNRINRRCPPARIGTDGRLVL